jgi:DNA-binding NtrC family response regulator
MTMPGMTGMDLSREILKTRPEIPIILCTGFNQLVSEENAKAIGIREFTMKPFSLQRIATLIRETLKARA